MRGSIKRRYKGSWSLILDLGYQTDPATGLSKRKQKWITYRGTKRQAEAKLAELVRSANRQEFVEPLKLTLGEWLHDWLTKSVEPRKAAGTASTYKQIIEKHLKPALGALRLQALSPLDCEAYYAKLGLAPGTAQLHHAVLHSALKAAVKAGLLIRNPAALVDSKPRARETGRDVLDRCWTEHEARAFLRTARETGPQAAAFYSFLLDAGCRKNEAAGLLWTDVDLDKRTVVIQRQLVKPGHPPTFGPTKTKTSRIVEFSEVTAGLLRTHKARQAEVKLANRTTYHDGGLVFAKDWADCVRHTDVLGDPLQTNNIGQREFARLVKAAGVRRIPLHGLRHTCATLLLQAGIAPNVVQRRLGHSRIEMTLNVYGHLLPQMQADAAARLANLLHG